MRRHAVFVPWGDEHVAAVVAVPDEPPRGLVLLLAGTGRHNVIGGTLSGHLSLELAERGLASVRLDYVGVGDSTGIVPTWTPADVTAAAAQARAALATVAPALGVQAFATAATCYGSRIALELLEDPACVGAVCLAPPIIVPGSSSVPRSPVAGPGRSSAWRSIAAAARRLAAGVRPKAAPALDALSRLDRARIVFLYGPVAGTDHDSPAARRRIDEALARVPAELRERFQLETLDAGPLTTFDGLPSRQQQLVVERVIPFVEACFELGPAPGKADDRRFAESA